MNLIIGEIYGIKNSSVGRRLRRHINCQKTSKKFKKLNRKDVSITIIDKNPFHTMLTELHEVAACRVDEDSIK